MKKFKGNESGQAMMEYLLILALVLTFTRFVYFNKQYGFKAILDKTMFKLGSFLEQNLKTGAQSGESAGGDGSRSLDPWVGVNKWKN